MYTELLPTGIPPEQDSSAPGIPPCKGFLPARDPSKNGIPPETGFLPKLDSFRNGIPPETGFLPNQDSSRNGITSVTKPVGRSFVRGVPGGRNPGEKSLQGGHPLGSSSMATIFFDLMFCHSLWLLNVVPSMISWRATVAGIYPNLICDKILVNCKERGHVSVLPFSLVRINFELHLLTLSAMADFLDP